MSKNSFMRNLAVASGSALVLSTLAAAPASAARLYPADYLSFAPTTGDHSAVFSLDELDMTLSMSALIPDSAAGMDLASLKISSADAPVLEIYFADAVVGNVADEISVVGLDADGVEVAIDADGVGNPNFVLVAEGGADNTNITEAADQPGAFVVDFDELGITDLIVYDIDGSLLDSSVNLTFRVLDNTADVDDSDFDYTNAEQDAATLSPYGDGSFDVDIMAFLETDADETTVDDNAGTTTTMSWYDQADVSAVVTVERFDTYLLTNTDTVIPANVKFSRTVNLDQINVDYWEFDIDSSVAGDDADDESPTKRTLTGLPDQDANGKLTVTVPMNGADVLDDGEKVAITVQAQDAAGDHVATARVFRSPQVTVVEAADNTTDGTVYSVAGGTDGVIDNEAGTVSLREGETSATYTIGLEDGGVAQGANRPVMAIVTFVDSNAATDTMTVSGHSRPLLQSGIAVVNGLTNADGEFSVTATVSDATAGVDYTVKFFYIDADGEDQAATVATITSTYATGDYDAITADSSVYNGASVTISVDVADQFEKAIDATAAGKAIKLRFEATNTDDLQEYVAVSGGSASLTFANWLAQGETDVITITAYTGDDDDPTDLAGAQSVTLYNSASVAAVTVTNDELTADVVYQDFATGDEGTVTDGSKTTISGSALDSSGQGVPGAQVTVSGAGIQFLNAAGDYTIGSGVATADEAGAWSIDMWTHLADDTDLTITSGAGSATATFTGELDNAGTLSAANLLMTWNLPSAVVVDTTYRVDATVTDVWGNPIANATVTFAGEAAAQFNSDASVAKTTNAKGVASAYLRSLDGVTGLAAVSITLSNNIDFDGDTNNDITDVGDTFTDVATTSWDESAASDEVLEEVTFLSSAPAAAASGDTKVNAGSFKGYVAIYAKGHMGKRLSAKVGKDWVVVGSLDSNFERVVEYTGAGYTIAVRIYIDRVLVDTITVVTK